MRETIVGVAVVALLVTGCGGTGNPPAPPAAQASPPAVAPTAKAAAPAASPRPDKRARKSVKVAWRAEKPVKTARGAKAEAPDAGEAPTLKLNQSPPSSY
jgi:hypothetical protein